MTSSPPAAPPSAPGLSLAAERGGPAGSAPPARTPEPEPRRSRTGRARRARGVGCAPRARVPVRSARAPARASAPRGGGGDGGDGDAARALPRPLPRLRGPPPGPWAARPSGRAERARVPVRPGHERRRGPAPTVEEPECLPGEQGVWPSSLKYDKCPQGAPPQQKLQVPPIHPTQGPPSPQKGPPRPQDFTVPGAHPCCHPHPTSVWRTPAGGQTLAPHGTRSSSLCRTGTVAVAEEPRLHSQTPPAPALAPASGTHGLVEAAPMPPPFLGARLSAYGEIVQHGATEGGSGTMPGPSEL
ncbi:mucin-1-like [Felis catus]|uniref:mucin-1-like n=1 Tax=Felis catus TaxID=9685 RepID=UPI000C2FD0D7|nr:mucin-1-like [Felis catus]